MLTEANQLKDRQGNLSTALFSLLVIQIHSVTVDIVSLLTVVYTCLPFQFGFMSYECSVPGRL